MMYLKDAVFHSSLLDSFSLVHGFGTRMQGDGRDITRVSSYLEHNKKLPRAIIKPHQTHSVHVAAISTVNIVDKIVNIPDTDGVVTEEKDILLTCITADCVPIIFVDPVAHVIGISHQGWKGTTDGMVPAMIQSMIKIGAQTSHIYCAFGPAINICCYHMNLYEINRKLLLEQGIKAQNIDVFPFCTCCDERFYSYRREGGIKGEMIHFVMMS